MIDDFCDDIKKSIRSQMNGISESMLNGVYKSFEDYKSACSKYAAYSYSCEIIDFCLKKFKDSM